MRQLYVYYKVVPAHAPSLLDALVAVQHRLRESMPGLACDIQRRVDARAATEEQQTWMETYRFNGFADERAWSALDAALRAALAGLPHEGMGPRVVEQFETLSSPRGVPERREP